MAAQEAKIQHAFGRSPYTAAALAQRIAEAGWPKEVILHPLDFMHVLATSGAGGTYPRDAEGRAFYWLANTKILCAPPTDAVLDLSTPQLIVPATLDPRDDGRLRRPAT